MTLGMGAHSEESACSRPSSAPWYAGFRLRSRRAAARRPSYLGDFEMLSASKEWPAGAGPRGP